MVYLILLGDFLICLNIKSGCEDRYKPRDTISSVTTGCMYQQLIRSPGFGKFDITLQFNTDGVNVSDSSNFAAWPILVAINELSHQTSRRNMMVAGVWCGKHKPVEAYLEK